MGSNEAGERRAGKEEALPRFPDGLIHHMQVQTHLPVLVTVQKCEITSVRTWEHTYSGDTRKSTLT